MKYALFCFAVTGWTLGLFVHLISFTGVDIADTLSFVWVLEAGIFVVWIPTVYYLKKKEELKAHQQIKTINPFGYFLIISRKSPTWLTFIAMGGFFYAMVSFILLLISNPGAPGVKDGQYILHSHGNLIKILTEQEYHLCKANKLRASSGHWLAFYGVATLVLYPFSRLETKE